jgi:osmotically-inducible protein OsmY
MKNTLAIAATIAVLNLANIAYAEDKLPKKPVSEIAEHMSWHEFRHELNSFPQVTASMTHAGMLTLAGHADNNTEKQKIEGYARMVLGVAEINNLISTD